MRLCVIDIETTGFAPPAEVIEVGVVDVTLRDGAWSVGQPRSQLFRPVGDIPAETMAVHHITERDFDEATPVFNAEALRALVFEAGPCAALAAHNADFERTFLAETLGEGAPWICTFKTALRVWPDAPRHTNQVLRYWRGLALDATLAMPPHRAAPDAYVTACLLVEQLKEAPVEAMLEWAGQPRAMPRLTFGKHRGQAWSAVPADYLKWMLAQSDMDGVARNHASEELARRTAA